MADYAALSAELKNDPLALGLVAATDANAATTLNTTNRPMTISVTVVPTYQLYEAFDPTEYSALTASQKTDIQSILGMGTASIASGSTARSVLATIFAGTAGPITRPRLAALTTQTVPRTRAQEIFGLAVTAADVHAART